MNVLNLATQAAAMKGWPSRREPNGDLRIEVVTQYGRTQVINVTMAVDGDRDPVAFIWSKAADAQTKNDPWGLLRLNMQLSYGRVALKGNDVVIMHSLLDRTSDLTEVGKTIFWVAKTADDLEQQTYGAYVDVL
ncbi:MAG: hypothetical protein JNJ59_18060 [Deltaproteobacteria bacterium]|jgi:hypothetical protein|nr:hypothetical protein [Deltaproteobacteria bacterium]